MSNSGAEMFRCTVIDPQGPGRGDATFTVRPERPVLHQMQMQGCTALPIGCRGGGCGVCRIEVLSGSYLTKRMSKKHVSEDDLVHAVVLACRIHATTDLVVRPARSPGHAGEIVLT